MFIQTQTTPNPNTLKFLPGQPVMPEGQTLTLKQGDPSAHAPFAAVLLALPDVAEVFLAHDFLSVRKTDAGDWDLLKPLVLTTVMEHLMSGRPIAEAAPVGRSPSKGESSVDNEIVAQIKEIIETRVRPAVAGDGGDITFEGFQDGRVFVKLEGACSGCPSSTLTLKHGIENLLRYYVPEVTEVVDVDAEAKSKPELL